MKKHDLTEEELETLILSAIDAAAKAPEWQTEDLYQQARNEASDAVAQVLWAFRDKLFPEKTE